MGKDPRADALSSTLRAAIEPTVAQLGIELVSVEVRGPHNKRTVRLVADADDGLDVDRIAQVSHAVSPATDELVSGSYTLEVTSPGVERPLTTPTHFRRNLGREMKVRHVAADGEGDTQTTGTLEDVREDAIVLATHKEPVEIAFADLSEGRIVLPW